MAFFSRRKKIFYIMVFVAIGIFAIVLIRTRSISHNILVTVLPNDSLSLITEPNDGIAPVISMISNATKSIDLVMYQLEDSNIEQALAKAESRGISLRVFLNKGYYGKQESDNESAYSYLEVNNIPVEWTPSYFALTHQKTLIVDGNNALIMTFNLTPQYYATTRDFGIIDQNQNDVSAIENTFNNDWQEHNAPAEQGNDLVWSPYSENEMLSLIQSATSTIEIYNEEMADYEITDALVAAARKGVDVKVVMTYSKDWKKAFDELSSAGVHVETYDQNAPLYIHAKMILVDDTQAFLGSENFSYSSLQNNRELGIIITNENILDSLKKTFTTDWQSGEPYRNL